MTFDGLHLLLTIAVVLLGVISRIHARRAKRWYGNAMLWRSDHHEAAAQANAWERRWRTVQRTSRASQRPQQSPQSVPRR